MLICNDLDLALLEPTIVPDCAAVATLVWQGSASVSGTTITTASGSLASPPVEPGMLAYFPASKVTALFVRRDSATTSSLCLLTPAVNNDAFPADLGDFAGPGDGTGLSLQIVTFPQIRPASDTVLDALGLTGLAGPGQFDVRAVRRAGAYLALAGIFRSMAAFDRTLVTSDSGTGHRYNDEFRALADHYRTLFDREIRRVRPWVDADEDGTREGTKNAGAIGLVRE